MSRQTEIQKLITEHERRLQILKEKEAKLGISTPPEILTEIEDIGKKIASLKKGATPGTVASPSPSSGKWSSLTLAAAGILIAIVWMIKDPGFEPLTALVAGLTAAGTLLWFKPSARLDTIFAVFIGLATIAAVIFLLLPSPGGNHPPVIHSLTASKKSVSTGEAVTITADATDQDEDPLSFIWSADRGTVPTGSHGPQIQYIAPQDPKIGLDTVKVTTTDGRGGTASQEIKIAIELQN